MSSITRFVNAVKKTSLGAVDAGIPVNVRVGTVKTVSPLSVLVDQRFILTSEFLVVTASASGLQVEDAVVLLRVQGGQQYVVLDKVVET